MDITYCKQCKNIYQQCILLACCNTVRYGSKLKVTMFYQTLHNIKYVMYNMTAFNRSHDLRKHVKKRKNSVCQMSLQNYILGAHRPTLPYQTERFSKPR